MRLNLLPVAALLLGVVGLVGGAGLLAILLPLRAALEGFPTLGIALIGGGYSVGFVIGCLMTPRLVDRVGHIRVFAALAATAASTALLHALVADIAVWVAVRAFAGFSLGGLYIVIESWLNHQAINETRGRLFAVYMMVNFASLMTGQLLLIAFDVALFVPFAVACLGICLSLVPIALSKAQAPVLHPVPRLGLVRLYRISPVGVVGCFMIGLGNGSFWTFGPLFAADRLGSAAGAAIFVSAVVLGGALGQWPLGRLSDKLDRRKVLVSANLAAASGGLALALWPAGGIVALLVLGGLTGIFMLSIYALCVAHTNDHIEAHDFVAASSGLLIFFGAGAVVGPLVASGMIEVAGSSGIFLWTTTVHLVLAAFTVLRMRVRAPVPEEERSDFVAMMRQTPVPTELDPRAEHEPDGREEAPKDAA